MKRIVTFLLVSFFILCGSASAATLTGQVVSIADGDTITVLVDKTQHKIRLAGIDTPEKSQDYGTRARQFTSERVFRKPVKVEVMTTDRYGRTVGMVYYGDKCLNEELIKAGYAWVYTTYCDYPQCPGWKKLEEKARKTKAGLWTQADPVPPWDFRKGKKTTAASATQTGGGVYHGNRKSHIFHDSSCRYFNCKNCTVVFNSKEEAVAAGYRGCKKCRP